MKNFLLLSFLSFGITNVLAFAHYQFRRASTTNGDAVNITGIISRTQTAIECARACSQNGLCSHFTWEAERMICNTIPWQGWLVTALLEETNDRSLYSRDYKCRTDLGYEFIALSSTVICIRYMEIPQNLLQAKESCKSLHGLLVKANTQEKVNKIKKNVSVGIGLDDEETEGTFVWSDGQPATPEEMKLFENTEPNGGVGENWGVVRTRVPALNDVASSRLFQYVCEIQM